MLGELFSLGNLNMDENCIFCKIIEGKINSEKVCEDKLFLVVKDIRPRTKGHSLVIPKKHFIAFENLPESHFESFSKITQKAVDILKKETKMEGYNLAMNNHPIAGQVISHMHLHIIPRTPNDGVKVIQ